MAASVSDKLWDLIDVAKMVDDWERGGMHVAEREFGGLIGYAQNTCATMTRKAAGGN